MTDTPKWLLRGQPMTDEELDEAVSNAYEGDDLAIGYFVLCMDEFLDEDRPHLPPEWVAELDAGASGRDYWRYGIGDHAGAFKLVDAHRGAFHRGNDGIIRWVIHAGEAGEGRYDGGWMSFVAQRLATRLAERGVDIRPIEDPAH